VKEALCALVASMAVAAFSEEGTVVGVTGKRLTGKMLASRKA
jgi:hypothetical protein